MKSKEFLISIVFYILTNTLLSAQNAGKLIPIIQLHEDLEILKSNLEQIHAGLYNYTPKVELDKKFEELKLGIVEPLTAIEFYRRIATLHKYIKNGHTILIPSEEFDDATLNTTPNLPLDVYWDQGGLYILRNNSDNIDAIPGVRIDSINGRSAPELFLDMADLWTRDGANKTFPQGITQRAFAGFYINFVGSPKQYNLVVKNKEGLLENIKLKGLTVPEIDKNRKKRYGDIHFYWQKGDGDAVAVKIKDKVAHLEIKTCTNSDIRKFGRSIKGIMKSVFKKISNNNVEHLIIDLRNNGGGEEIISRELFRHIAQKPFVLFKDSYLITKKIPNKNLYSERIGLMNTFAKVGVYKAKDGYYRLNSFGSLLFRSYNRFKEHKPYNRSFKGAIYTLTNAYSFSAAGEIASSIKTNTESIFIGEEPGGNTHKVVAGEVFTLVLPNSGNRARIPIANQIVNSTVVPEDRGVLPDHMIRNTIADELNGRDAMLDFTYDLIKKQNSPPID
ncbi:MAG: S41 family peptidase [Maribacter sp.]